jgi:hypothetical protein
LPPSCANLGETTIDFICRQVVPILARPQTLAAKAAGVLSKFNTEEDSASEASTGSLGESTLILFDIK